MEQIRDAMVNALALVDLLWNHRDVTDKRDVTIVKQQLHDAIDDVDRMIDERN